MLKKPLYAIALTALALPALAANSIVEMKTSMGNIEIELYNDKAPISAKNFEDYIKDNFYKGTIFHRVIPGFMVQGAALMRIWWKSQIISQLLRMNLIMV